MSEVRIPAPVKAKLLQDDWDESDKTPGTFGFVTYQGADAGVMYVCPCGCGSMGYLRIRGAPRPPEEADRPSWVWDGNREEPTLDPSVHHVGHWHGYLKKGYWTQA